MRFDGDAAFNGGGYLRFEKLLFTGKHASFDLDWFDPEHGHWHAIGIASKDENGAFKSSRFNAVQNGKLSDPITMQFTAEISPEHDVCSITGVWSEAGELYSFSGTLHAPEDNDSGIREGE